MAEDAPNLTPALRVTHSPLERRHEHVPVHQVTHWGVSLDAKQNWVVLHLSDIDVEHAEPTLAHVLSIPAAKQMSEALRKAVEDYLTESPQPEKE